jgi:hypothetical protein
VLGTKYRRIIRCQRNGHTAPDVPQFWVAQVWSPTPTGDYWSILASQQVAGFGQSAIGLPATVSFAGEAG